MKKNIFSILLTYFTIVAVSAQPLSFFTFSGNGDWTDISHWDTYPGTTFTGWVSINGNVNINTDVTIYNEGGMFNFGNININNSGSLNISASYFIPDDMVTIFNSGTIDVYGYLYIGRFGLLENSPSAFIDIFDFGILYTSSGGDPYFYNGNYYSSDGIINNYGNLNNYASIDNYGTINNCHNLVNIGPISGTGKLSGWNVIHQGNFNNSGILSPGCTISRQISNDIGDYVFNNEYSHNNSTLQIELESTSSYDKIFIIENANLSGNLTVNLVNGFVPNIGDSFVVLTAGNISGTFNTANLPTLSANSEWNIIYTATTVTLNVSSTLSVLNLELASFKLYPNPAKDLINIQLDNSIELKTVNVYNMMSQVVFTTKSKNINISKLSAGFYFVEIITNKGKSINNIIIE